MILWWRCGGVIGEWSVVWSIAGGGGRAGTIRDIVCSFSFGADNDGGAVRQRRLGLEYVKRARGVDPYSTMDTSYVAVQNNYYCYSTTIYIWHAREDIWWICMRMLIRCISRELAIDKFCHAERPACVIVDWLTAQAFPGIYIYCLWPCYMLRVFAYTSSSTPITLRFDVLRAQVNDIGGGGGDHVGWYVYMGDARPGNHIPHGTVLELRALLLHQTTRQTKHSARCCGDKFQLSRLSSLCIVHATRSDRDLWADLCVRPPWCSRRRFSFHFEFGKLELVTLWNIISYFMSSCMCMDAGRRYGGDLVSTGETWSAMWGDDLNSWEETWIGLRIGRIGRSQQIALYTVIK